MLKPLKIREILRKCISEGNFTALCLKEASCACKHCIRNMPK